MIHVRRGTLALVVLLMAVTAGCAGTRNGDGQAARSDRLTREDIMSVQGAGDLYEVVQRLRPRWLTVRSAERSFNLATSIVVYQDQSRLGGVDQLRQLNPSSAYELRYLDGATATSTLPGLGSGQNVAGAIVIVTRPAGE